MGHGGLLESGLPFPHPTSSFGQLLQASSLQNIFYPNHGQFWYFLKTTHTYQVNLNIFNMIFIQKTWISFARRKKEPVQSGFFVFVTFVIDFNIDVFPLI